MRKCPTCSAPVFDVWEWNSNVSGINRPYDDRELTALRERCVKLETTIRKVLADSESQLGGWGPDITMISVLQAALENKL